MTTADSIRPPAEYSSDELDAFCQLVARGRQVDTAGLRDRVGRARWLGLHYEDGDLAAVAALKRPTGAYREKIFRNAEVLGRAGEFATELGWVVTREEYRNRGISRHLLGRLLERAGREPVFATTRTDNRPMQAVLASVGFEPIGQPFAGRHGNHLLRLWVRTPGEIPVSAERVRS